MSPSWQKLLRRLALIFLAAGLVGALADQLLLVLLLAAVASLAWQLRRLYQIDCWLSGDRDASPPQAGPIWDGIAAHIARLRRQSRKRKRKLSKLLRQVQQATAALPDAAVVLGEDDRVLWCNGAAHHLLGLSSARDIGLQVAHLLRHPDFIAFLNRRRQGELVERRYSDNVEFPAPVDDTRLLSARIVPYGKKQRLLLATDISRVRRLEQVRRDFVANVSHELRTPLTVISGYLETLLDSDSPALEQWRQPLHGMQQQSRRMLHIVEDLLLLARLESRKERPPRKPVNVPALLASIVDDAIALSDEHGHHIEVNADPDLWISGSEKELHSAFSNLVFNAVRYTPANGRILIRWFTDQDGIHLAVEDNGEGIAPHHIPRLTERFYRINRDRSRGSGGTGLGLSIVKHVLNRHDATLEVESVVGKGSRFVCCFPVKRIISVHAQDPLQPTLEVHGLTGDADRDGQTPSQAAWEKVVPAQPTSMKGLRFVDIHKTGERTP